MENTSKFCYFVSFFYEEAGSPNPDATEVKLSRGMGNTSTWRDKTISDIADVRQLEKAISIAANLQNVVVSNYVLMVVPRRG
jgi:hypothetical protein